ncbi:hypothetical protein C3E98_005910 [Pseudomonas sp. MWU13-2625]|uniref:hypothetical protein n=1 Tax=unclassified Pseudomonas TaxID=196821 RepID=UPI000CD5A9F2|nr:hypothetical protein [Pseudomonas sp. MWU12-2020]RBB99864.1 hypothetical protein C3E97_018655 [Pseudomonas sp. MWU12-2115]RBL72094.1 hypothetical protein C3E98_005910 [Pseudomonas sp. MWU13-2625]
MIADNYRQLGKMGLEFVSGALEQDADRKVLSYTVTFRLSLDFINFVVMTGQFVPGYLDDPLNAIRPELGGFAYHFSYNYFFSAAGNIKTSEALFKVFANPEYYSDSWATADLEHRYHKPAFQYIDGGLQVTARRDYRWADGREIEVADLPIIPFGWELNVLQGHEMVDPPISPATAVIVGYASEDMVDVGGLTMRKGTRYMIGSELRIGAISEVQILTA